MHKVTMFCFFMLFSGSFHCFTNHKNRRAKNNNSSNSFTESISRKCVCYLNVYLSRRFHLFNRQLKVKYSSVMQTLTINICCSEFLTVESCHSCSVKKSFQKITLYIKLVSNCSNSYQLISMVVSIIGTLWMCVEPKITQNGEPYINNLFLQIWTLRMACIKGWSYMKQVHFFCPNCSKIIPMLFNFV